MAENLLRSSGTSFVAFHSTARTPPGGVGFFFGVFRINSSSGTTAPTHVVGDKITWNQSGVFFLAVKRSSL